MGNYGSLIVKGASGEYDNAGFEVSGIGDINGDGYDDFAVTARYGDTYIPTPFGGYDRQTGTVYVVYGSAEPDLEIDLADIDGTNGFEITADPAVAGGGFYGGYTQSFGSSIAALGDVNGDGVDDFAIAEGATDSSYGGYYGEYGYYYSGGEALSGVVYVIFGGQDVTTAQVGVDTLDHVRLDVGGEVISVVGLGDVNGDGLGDIAVNESARDQYESRTITDTYLYDANGNGVYDYDPDTNPNEFQNENQRYVAVDKVTGYVLFGVDTDAGGSFTDTGNIAPAGGSGTIIDLAAVADGDGFATDAGFNVGNYGYYGYYYGEFGEVARFASSVVVGGYSNYDETYANGIIGAADIDGDGFADIIVDRGGVYVEDILVTRSPGDYASSYGGAFGLPDDTAVIDGQTGITETLVDGLLFPEDLAVLGDVSGNDGAFELAARDFARSDSFDEIDADRFGFGIEGVVVLNGATDLFDRTSFTTPIGRVQLDGDASFYYAEGLGDGSGRLVPQAILDIGNVIGDATDDFAIIGRESSSGEIWAYVVAGTAAARIGIFDLEVLVDAGQAYRIEGRDSGGFSYGDRTVVAAAGDVNGDGFDDIIVGEARRGDDYSSGDGRATVIFGGAALEASDQADGTDDNRLLFDNTIVDVETGLLPIEVSIQRGSIFQDEGTDFIFTVSRTGDLTAAVSVDFAVTPDGTFFTDADADDFTGGVFPTGTVSFAAGESTADLIVPVADDDITENTEDFTVTLSNPVTDNGAPISLGNADAVGLINNDDLPVTFAVFGGTVAAFEGGPGDTTDFLFTITRSGETDVAASVDYRILGFSAGNNADDFVSDFNTPATVDFAAGETSKTVTVQVRGDADAEADEFFQVVLENPVAADGSGTSIADGSRFGQILTDDTPSEYRVFSSTVTEGGTLSFTVTRSGDTSGAGSVDYAFTPFASAASRATAPDFQGGFPAGGTVGFAAGETSKQVTVGTVDDAVFENTEFVNIALSNPVGGTQGAVISQGSATGTIVDNEIPVRFRISSDSVTEGGALEFVVTRSGDTSVAASVEYTLQPYRFGGSADDADIVGSFNITGSLSFAAGQTSQTITLDTVDDLLFENTEYLEAVLSNPASPAANAQAVITQGLAYGYIYDNDVPVYFSVRGSTVFEGDAGDDNQLVFTITRSGDTTVAASVDYDLTGGTVTAADFDETFPTSGTLDFAAGERTKTVSIGIQGDSVIENDEYTFLTLSNPDTSAPNAIAQILTGTASATIRNDDNPAFIAVDSYSSVVEGDPGEVRELVFTIRRSGDTQSEVTVDYGFTSDTFAPLSSNDIEGGLPSTGQVTFGVGQTVQQVRFGIVEDDLIEGNERGRLTLTAASATGGFNQALITRATAIGVVENDDLPPTLTVTANGSRFFSSVTEGNSGLTPVDITFARSGDDSAGVTVRYRLETDGGAFGANSQDVDTFLGQSSAPADAGNLFVTFDAGETQKTVTVNVIGDGIIETNETFQVSVKEVSSLTGVDYTVATPETTISIRNDDGRPPVPQIPVDTDGDGVPDDFITVEADVFGDPHIVTLDGLGYDFQAVGDYVLVETVDGVDNPFSVQVRFEAFPGSDLVSVTTRMAVEVAGAVVEIDALNPDAPLLIDGTAPADSPTGAYDLDGDGTNDIFIEDGKYFITLNEGNDQLMVGIVGATLNVCVFLGDPAAGGNAGQVQGLMGNANQDLTDDFGLRDGSTIPETEISFDADDVPALSFDFLYGFGDYEDGGYRGSWALGTDENLFSGATPDFPENFPAAPLSLDNLPADLLEQARAAAIAAGLDPEDDPVVFDNAVLDFALTGLNDFLAGATQLAADPEVATEATEAPDLPSTVSVAADAGQITEGDAGVQSVFFTFTRTVPEGALAADLPTLSVDYAIGGDVDAADLAPGTLLSGQVAFAAGETQTTLEVLVTGDLDTEADEALAVSITGTGDAGVLVAGAQGVTTILTDDFAPEAEDDGVSGKAGDAITGNLIDDNGQGPDSDADGDSLSVTAVVLDGTTEIPVSASPIPLGGGATLSVDAEGNFTVETGDAFDALAPGEIDTVAFDYIVSDGNGGTDRATATVTVQGVAAPENAAPVAAPDDIITDEDTAVSADLLGNDSDPENDDLSVVAAFDSTGAAIAIGVAYDLPEGGRVTITEDGGLLYDPDGDLEALGFNPQPEPPPQTIALSYVVSDGDLQATGDITIGVRGVNDAPDLLTADLGAVSEDAAPVSFDALAAITDVDSPAGDLSVSNVTASWSGGALTATQAGGVIGFDPDQLGAALNAGDTAAVTITFDSSDGIDTTTGNTLTLEVTGADDGPTGPTLVEGTDGIDRLTGTAAEERFVSKGGRIDYQTGGGGADEFAFGSETTNGVIETDYITDFGTDDSLDLGGVGIAREINSRGNTYLVLEGDGDVIALLGVADYDDGLLTT